MNKFVSSVILGGFIFAAGVGVGSVLTLAGGIVLASELRDRQPRSSAYSKTRAATFNQKQADRINEEIEKVFEDDASPVHDGH